jgi:hypothetical protein
MKNSATFSHPPRHFLSLIARGKIAAAALATLFLSGCGGSGEDGAQGIKASGNVIAGRVTMEDGQPLRGNIKDIQISIYGVSEAAERVNYSPAVKPDGTYRQKVAGGQYAFNTGRVVVLHGDIEFAFPLEAVGNLWNKNRDAADGIVQDFVWKVTGPTPYGRSDGLNPANATHWHGMSIGLRADGWRNDINKAPRKLPNDTKLAFTLRPTSQSIDGRPVQPVTIERTHHEAARQNPDLNDLIAASYELSGTATLPDGTVTPLLLQGPGDYPNYKPVTSLPLIKDGIIGGIRKHAVSFVIE